MLNTGANIAIFFDTTTANPLTAFTFYFFLTLPGPGTLEFLRPGKASARWLAVAGGYGSAGGSPEAAGGKRSGGRERSGESEGGRTAPAA